MLARKLRFALASFGVAALLSGCGAAAPEAGEDSYDDTATSCAAYASPDTNADCGQCDSSSSSCQPNGCFGGYLCDTSTYKCVAKEPAACKKPPPAPADPKITSFFTTPSSEGQEPVIDAIQSAKSSIEMIMFHLTVEDVTDALAAAAKSGVAVHLIMDVDNWTSHTPAAIKTELAKAGVVVTTSSTGFAITHCKAILIDGKTTLISTMNLTSDFATTRDYGVFTSNAGVAKDFKAVFQADLANAKDNGTSTPTLTSPYLLWSPFNSESTLVSFIESATRTLVVDTENLGDENVMSALYDAVARGVSVRVMSPMCDKNANPLYDIPFINQLIDKGAKARTMPTPELANQPYMHAKLMIADGKRAYVGSMNLSTSSLTKAREVGILITDPNAIASFAADFEQDWTVAVVPPDASTISCPTVSDGGP